MAFPAVAHHSFNTFDMARTIKVEGVGTSFKLMSPHSEMLLEVSGPDGKVIPWRVTARTGAVPAKRQAWRPQDFIGKRLTVDENPSRNPVVGDCDGWKPAAGAAFVNRIAAGPRSSSGWR